MIWAAVLIGLVAAAGIGLRLEDPLSDGVIPAEDPYTHMALVREHLRDGEFDPLYESGSLYPPGMHAYLGAVWVFSGAELYHIMLIGPAVLGGIGIVGVGLLGTRLQGPVAGVLAAAAWAVAPESIFRTSMMSPTALDLAILPFFLLALVEVIQGRLAWLSVAAPIAVFLIAAHPWLLLLLAAAGFVFMVLILAAPWPRTGQARANSLGFAVAVALLGLTVAITTHTRSGFSTLLSEPLHTEMGILVALMLGFAVAPLLLWILVPRLRLVLDRPRRSHHVLWRVALSAGLLAALVAITMVAAAQGFPEQVDLARMFGWPILILGAAGLVLMPFMRGPLSYVGASLVVATYPLVIFNPLDSPFWPHRTAVFFGLGVVLLVGVASAAFVRAARQLIVARARAPSRAETHAGHRSWKVPAASLTIALLLGVTVVGASPTGYPDGWYRLYATCEMDALREVADRVEEDDSAIIITGTWQAKLVLAALTEDASRVWFKPDLFLSEEERALNAAHWDKSDAPVYVLVEPHIREELPPGSTDFLEADQWQNVGEWCHGFTGKPEPRIIAYEYRGASS